MSDQYAELAAQNEALREALRLAIEWADECESYVRGDGSWQWMKYGKDWMDSRAKADAALAATPSASLAKHDERVRAEEREACARICENNSGNAGADGIALAEGIRARAMKGETT